MPKNNINKYPENKIFRKYGNILGVGITGTSNKILLNKILDFLRKNRRNRSKLASIKPLFITTPNSEQLVIAYDDPKYKDILNISDVALCDSVGLLAAYEYLKNYGVKHSDNYFVKIQNFVKSIYKVAKRGRSSDGLIRITKGRRFFLDLLKMADSKRYKVFLLGSTSKILKRAVNRLLKIYPSVHIKTHRGASFDLKSVPLTDKEIKSDKTSLKMINRFAPDMLFVAFGAPKQEMWVYRNLENLKTGLVMVVGSSFDYIAGTRKKVPHIAERLGMEWLWRLMSGSQNIRRIFNAVIRFPYLILKDNTGNKLKT